ncbi:Uncharacterised protein [Chlamydia trachomatis]|nr:Uncharacterised protein [Chlamydia trachomatis]
MENRKYSLLKLTQILIIVFKQLKKETESNSF